ncbi:hypothetical protein V9T40_009422 [Parthenolecanium corni]|uniref:RING-type domain-containing protein n=1 Tax=Parthenolecanium corni TaxID=536013 RepID=A0AAN9TSA2_9HEMI
MDSQRTRFRPVNTANVGKILCWEACAEVVVPGNSKKHDELGYQFVLEVTDSDSEVDSSESVFSIQAETTAKDSSDISTNEDSDKYFSEYELASSSDGWLHPWSFDRNISSESSPHQSVVDTAMKELFAQTEESHCSSKDNAECLESELDSDSDCSVFSCRFEYCAMCSSRNDNPSFQFCHSCYQIKKTFFPEKPVGKRKRKQNPRGSPDERAAKRSKLLDEATTELRVGSSSPEALCSIVGGDSGFESLNSQNSVQSGDSQPDGSSSSTSSTLSSSMGSSIDATNGSDIDHMEKCLACLRSSTNALFLHGKTGHRCCCYPCAKRIWLESGRCPICRSKVSNIIRILNV